MTVQREGGSRDAVENCVAEQVDEEPCVFSASPSCEEHVSEEGSE
jgi:hypothetical protein